MPEIIAASALTPATGNGAACPMVERVVKAIALANPRKKFFDLIEKLLAL
jgi:hypothetical protein